MNNTSTINLINGCTVLAWPNGASMELGNCSIEASVGTMTQAAAYRKEQKPADYSKVAQEKLSQYTGFMPARFREEDNSWALLEQYGKDVNRFNVKSDIHDAYHLVTTVSAVVLPLAAAALPIPYVKVAAGSVITGLKGIDKVWSARLKIQEKEIEKSTIQIVKNWTLTDQDKQDLLAMSKEEQLEAFDSFLVNNPVWQATQKAKYLPPSAKAKFLAAFSNNHHIFAEILGTDPIPDKELGEELSKAGKAVAAIEAMPKQWEADLKELKGMLSDHEKDLKQINQYLQTINQNTQEGNQILRFMVDVQYKNLTTAEKIEGIKEGIYPKKIGQLETLELLHKWEKTEKTVNAISTGLLTGVHIARQLGVKLPKNLEKGVLASQKVFQVIMGASTGNPMQVIQAIGSIVGLFKGAGPDIGTLRHQQLVDMLSVIHEDNQQIMAMIKQTQEMIAQLYDLNVAIAQGVQVIGETILKNHIEVMDALKNIHTDIFYLHDVLRQQLLTYLDRFEELDTALNAPDNDYHWERGVFKTHQYATSFFHDHLDQYNTAMGDAALKFQFSGANLDPTLRFEIMYTKQDSEPIDGNYKHFYTNIWGSAFRYYQQLTGNDKPHLCDFFEPVIHVDDLDSLLLSPAQIDPQSKAKEIADTCQKFLGQLIAPYVVLETGKYAINFHRYDPQIKNQQTGELFTEEDLFSPNYIMSYPQKRGKRILERILHFTTLSIVQHTLLSGGPMIPGLYRDFFEKLGDADSSIKGSATLAAASGSAASPPTVNEMAQVLGNNSIIAKNGLLYALRKKLGIDEKKNNNSQMCIQYRQAYNYSTDSTSLCKLFPGWKFAPHKDENGQPGWLLVCPFKYFDHTLAERELTIQMIRPSELFHGKLDYPIDLLKLLDLRGQLIAELVSYDLIHSVAGNEGLKRTLVENIFYSV